MYCMDFRRETFFLVEILATTLDMESRPLTPYRPTLSSRSGTGPDFEH